MMMNNPYRWNEVNPNLCYGRDGLLSDLLSGLPGSTRYSFGIAGGRRMGKTTLLRRVEADLKRDTKQWSKRGLQVIPLYVDGLILPRNLSISQMWYHLLKLLGHHLPGISIKSDIVLFEDFIETLHPIFASMEKRPRIVILFDEIELITTQEWALEFFGNWRALLSNLPGLREYFAIVVAGARELSVLQHDIASPLQNVMVWRNLQNLDFEDMCLLMTQPIDAEWEEPFMRRIYDETGGHPMLIQYIMQHICMESLDEAEQNLQAIIEKFEEEHGWQFMQWWNRYCTPVARQVYACLPNDGSTIPKRTLTQEFGIPAYSALEILQHIGIIKAEDDGFSYRYAGEMFHRWWNKSVKAGFLSTTPEERPTIENHNKNKADRVHKAPSKLEQNDITFREYEVLQLLAEGLTNKGIASRLSISEATANTHVRHILEKLEAHNRTHAVTLAFQKELLNTIHHQPD